MVSANHYWYIPKQWVALNSHADWLLKLRISIAIHLRAICVEFAPENVVIFAEINELKSSFCAMLSNCISIIILKQLQGYSPQCRFMANIHHYPPPLW